MVSKDLCDCLGVFSVTREDLWNYVVIQHFLCELIYRLNLHNQTREH